VPKFELVATDRAGAAVMVQACIQVVSGSKLRQAATYAADFLFRRYAVWILVNCHFPATCNISQLPFENWDLYDHVTLFD
jgi:hypothetical protein